MPEIHPFRALHYDPVRIGDLAKVISQPYDKVDDALREEYYARHPNHVVRVDKRKDGEKDKYTAAALDVGAWIKAGVLVEDPAPALYAFHQTYKVDGRPRTRKGLCAMVKLEEPGKGKILPHEETHAGPKIDRFKLLAATGVHFGHIFLLYSDAAKVIGGQIDAATNRVADLKATDDYGVVHEAWRITDPKVLTAVTVAMAPKEAIIADGHHRYETAWAFRNDRRAAGVTCEGAESFDNVLATLVNMDDEGLTCFGTHRVIRDKAPLDRAAFLAGLKGDFDVREYRFANADEELRARAKLIADLPLEGAKTPAFGLALPSTGHALFKVRDVRQTAARIKAPKSEDWRSLDNNILHSVVLEGMMGITPDDTAHERFVDYYRSADDAVARVLAGKSIAAFLVNPVTMDQLRKVVSHGERFPQKSTDYYPKIITGMLMARLNYV